jgi:steroid delta-isomerase-like uncharacterized protein
VEVGSRLPADQKRRDMSEENKALVRRAVDEIYPHKNPDAADEVYSPDFIDHDTTAPEEMRRGPEGVKQQVAMFAQAFPDLELTLEAQLAEGDLVATRWSARGTHQGELMGIPPSGSQVSVGGITIARIADGKIVEEWTNWDGLGMMQQIGAIPAE